MDYKTGRKKLSKYGIKTVWRVKVLYQKRGKCGCVCVCVFCYAFHRNYSMNIYFSPLKYDAT
jgi:hypothetical protein